MVGEEPIGEILTAPYDMEGETWAPVRLSDASLAQTANALSESALWLPGIAEAMELNVVPLALVGRRGLYHRNIIASGPFSKSTSSPNATYPALWNHNARNENRIVCQADSQLLVKQGMEDRVADVWATASRSHLNIEFTFGSQALAVAFTEQKSLGSSVWPNVIFTDERFDYTLAAWGNTTLGLIMHWWQSSRQQSSKARMTVTTLETLPILDFRTLSDDQLTTAKDIFDDFRERDLKPAYLADADPNRAPPR